MGFLFLKDAAAFDLYMQKKDFPQISEKSFLMCLNASFSCLYPQGAKRGT